MTVFVIPKILECLQLEAARIVTGLPIYSSAESLYFETGWSKLEDRRKSRKLNLFYKIENNMAPTYLSDCLPTTIGETVTYISVIMMTIALRGVVCKLVPTLSFLPL